MTKNDKLELINYITCSWCDASEDAKITVIEYILDYGNHWIAAEIRWIADVWYKAPESDNELVHTPNYKF